jgi:hypothetical protein
VNETDDPEVTVRAMQAQTSANEKVIYQYRLLKRIRRHPLISLVYLGFLALGLLVDALWQDSFGILLWGIGAIVGWHAVYYVVTAALLSREKEEAGYDQRYGWLFGWPWCGYLPTSNVPFRHYRWIQTHLLVVGALATAALAAWVPPAATAAIGFVHLWWMAPRLFLGLALKRSAKPGSIIALTPADAGLYSP